MNLQCIPYYTFTNNSMSLFLMHDRLLRPLSRLDYSQLSSTLEVQSEPIRIPKADNKKKKDILLKQQQPKFIQKIL